jgi:hypothetical protein
MISDAEKNGICSAFYATTVDFIFKSSASRPVR